MKNLRSKAAKRLGDQLSEHWDLEDPAAQTLLEELLDSYDRLQSHKAVLAKRGAVCRDRFGQENSLSPAFLAVRDETVTFSRLLTA
jgi:phage terminase small subunit